MFSCSSLLLAFTLVASYASAAVLHFGLGTGFGKRAPGDVITHCTVNGTVALTFDDGPFRWLNEISDALTTAGANGTFFFNGDNWGCIYNEDMAARVKYAYDAGHQVASHTWNHLHLNTLNQHQLHVQFWLVEEAIYRITGAYPAFTRPPFGEYNQLVQEVAGLRGQTLANWDFDSRDSAGATGAQSLGSYNSLIASRPSSILTLNHEITASTPQILPEVIRDLQAAGYRLTTLADCLGESPYQWVDEPQERDAEWTCQGRVW
jgi:peptidoglycan/xylan/chitin deacetylase (PgdA/CDA1 family)